jgi:hypothetical protein
VRGVTSEHGIDFPVVRVHFARQTPMISHAAPAGMLSGMFGRKLPDCAIKSRWDGGSSYPLACPADRCVYSPAAAGQAVRTREYNQWSPRNFVSMRWR